MKELSIEEKAKAYDEAFRIAQELYNDPNSSNIGKGYICTVFPELKETDDERIRKELINYFINGKEYLSFCSFSKEEILAWLEKQGEQMSDPRYSILDKLIKADDIYQMSVNDAMVEEAKNKAIEALSKLEISKLLWLEKQGDKKPIIEMKSAEESLGIDSETYNKIVEECIYGENKPADKVEPKFKVGDWVVLSTSDGRKIVHIVSIEYFPNGQPRYITSEGRWFGNGTKAHLWTIQDAKPGDVLACPNDAGDRDVVFIFKNINIDEGWVFCFCASDANGCFCTNNDYVGNSNSTNISPATKEQRDLLFLKMKEAGYEWDAELKQLKKLEQNPAWNEEDEEHIESILKRLDGMCKKGATFTKTRFAVNQDVDWLKSFKERIKGE